MDQKQISPGWALFTIFVLWGVASALDEPLDVNGPQAQQIAAAPAVRLECHADETGAGVEAFTGRRPVGVHPETFGLRDGEPATQAAPPAVFRCLVIDE